MDVTREVELDAPAGQVWETVTDPDHLLAWLGYRVVWDLRPGGDAVFIGPDGVRSGVVEVVDEPRRLVFRWDGSRVEFTILPGDRATTFRVVETPLLPDRSGAPSNRRPPDRQVAKANRRPQDWPVAQASLRAHLSALARR